MNVPVATCPRCTTVLRQRGDHSFCPRCLVRTALACDSTAGPTLVDGKNAPEPGDLAPLFPDLEIDELLGAGGMGLVYKARQTNLDRVVALKLLPGDPATANPEFAERFEREARSLARLNHPDFVQIYDQGRVEGWFFIIMEFVDGPDLAGVLSRDGPIAPARAMALFTRLCHALAEAHRRGIVHRDVKPANLLLHHGELLKVADLGLAKLLDPSEFGFTLTGDRAALGTPYYMAPEQRAGDPDIDQRADIYSLGVVFYEMLTGEIPTGRFKPPSQLVAVNPAIDAVIFKALQTRPDDRYADLDEMLGALEKAKRAPWRHYAITLPLLSVLVMSAALIGRAIDSSPTLGTGSDGLDSLAFDWSRALTVVPPAANEPGFFGVSTDFAMGLLVISAPGATVFEPESTLAGKVHIYRFDDRSAPELRATLQAPDPRPGDQFGFAIDLSPDGGLLSVVSFTNESNIPNCAVHLYAPADASAADWRLVETLEFPPEFGGLETRIRTAVSDPWLVVASPDLPPDESVRIFRRTDDGWNLHSTLEPDVPLTGDSHFGFRCGFHNDQLFVGSHRHGSGPGYRTGALSIFALDADGTWSPSQHLRHPSSTMLAYFGLDWTFPAPGQLAVGAFGDTSEGLIGTGSVISYSQDPATGRWTQDGILHPPGPTVAPAGFGQQVVSDGSGLLAVFATGGSHSDSSLESLVHVFATPAEAGGPWKHVRRVRAEPWDTLWVGRRGFTGRHLLIASPQARSGRTPNSGLVYLIPKEAL